MRLGAQLIGHKIPLPAMVSNLKHLNEQFHIRSLTPVLVVTNCTSPLPALGELERNWELQGEPVSFSTQVR